MRTIILALTLAGLGSTFATGCVTDAGGDDGAEPGGGGDGKADGATPGTLAAKYGLSLTSTMNLEDSRETDPAKRFTTITLRARGTVTTKPSDAGVTLTAKLCDIVLPTVSGYQPELDAEFVATLPPLLLTGAIDADGTLVTEPIALVLGAKLADPLESPLPAANSPRVFDQDGDGLPAVSIKVAGYGSIYAAMRVKLDLKIPLTGAATTTGKATIVLDQAIYGDDIWFYDAVSSFAQSQQFVKVTSATNTVKLRAGLTTCASVRAAFP
jgi:hypothetical protein